jgi:hypothetical protein
LKNSLPLIALTYKGAQSKRKYLLEKVAKEIMIRNSFCVVEKKKNYTEEKK